MDALQTIVKSEYLSNSGKLKIKLWDVLWLYVSGSVDEYSKNIISNIVENVKEYYDIDHKPDDIVEIEEFCWFGGNADDYFTTLELHIAPRLIGEADIIFTLNDGEKVGVTIKDGEMIRRNLKVVFE